MNRLILFGPPGSGKGTEAGMMTKDWKIPQISTGDIFRMNISEGTELGKKAKAYMDRGDLVPDDLVTELVVGRLAEDDAKEGYILDGYPRTTAQAESLNDILTGLGEQIDHVIYLKCKKELLIQRLTSRRICEKCGKVYNMLTMPPKEDGICDVCGGAVSLRNDDGYETAVKRLEVYEKQTMPLIEFYKKEGLLSEVDGAGTAEVVHERIKMLLGR